MPKTKTKNKAERAWLRKQVLQFSYQGTPRSVIAEKLGLSLVMVDYYQKKALQEQGPGIEKVLLGTRDILLARLIRFEQEVEKVRFDLREAYVQVDRMLKRLGTEYEDEPSAQDLVGALLYSEESFEHYEQLRSSLLKKYCR